MKNKQLPWVLPAPILDRPAARRGHPATKIQARRWRDSRSGSDVGGYGVRRAMCPGPSHGRPERYPRQPGL